MTRLERFRAGLSRVVRADLLQDYHVYGGLLLGAIGGWQISPPWTLIATGAILLGLGILIPTPRGHDHDSESST